MGTVFPISTDGWADLVRLLPELPPTIVEPGSALPQVFAWPQRAKGVLPMPGGYSGYLESLRQLCRVVENERPATSELASRLETELNVSATAARLRASFLRKVAIIAVQGDVCGLGSWTEKWLEAADDRIIVALLHSRCRLIGELLEAALEPRSTEDLLRIANDRYGMGWDTQTQIANRRGWLQSSNMLTITDTGLLETTPLGRRILDELTLHDPAGTPTDTPLVRPTPEPPEAPDVTPTVGEVDSLGASLTTSATDSHNPDRFERAVRDAFAFLGFHAEWLGGSGRTDVLLDALLGLQDSYRVIVDCKTSGSSSVGDQQVDWVTLADHKRRHDAQYVAVVAPSPAGARLFERARQQDVTVVSVDQLVGLVRQHARAPLGLDDYRALFQAVGVLDTAQVDERADEVSRLSTLAAAACDAIRERSPTFGRLSARDLFLILSGSPAAEGTSEDELGHLLDTLASPLLRVLEGSPARGFRVTTSVSVSRLRLEHIARRLVTGDRDSQ